MRKDVNDYKVYVFDLDGTLYDQPRLRKIMFLRLVSYYMCHPFSAGDLILLSHFRAVKDKWTDSASEDDIIKRVAEDKNADPARIRRIVDKWIYENPLSALVKTKDYRLIGWIKKLRESGRKAVIFSDYPAQDKLSAMNVTVDGMYDPTDERLNELKPSPKGLKVIMEDLNVAAEDMLMIGDREEKDGRSASSAGVDHLILPRKISKRNYEGFNC